jgi:acetate---CoA ligase (ADP-forming)
MLRRVRSARDAADLRGPLPTEPAAQFIARFSQLAASAPWDRFVFEVNPVAWRRDGAIALDGLLVIGEGDDR